MRFILQVEIIVAAVSLFTIFMLWILQVPIPRALLIVLFVSLILIIISLVIARVLKKLEQR